MTVKRRNHGRARKNCGSKGLSKLIVCDGCGSRVAKDKAIIRFQVRGIADASSMRDLKEASAYENYQIPKMYQRLVYCVDCAVHRRIVRGRSKKDRKNRDPPIRRRRQEAKTSK
eukprot:GSMAST32.ASY1.ANO1.1076.1 assembled CDS